MGVFKGLLGTIIVGSLTLTAVTPAQANEEEPDLPPAVDILEDEPFLEEVPAEEAEQSAEEAPEDDTEDFSGIELFSAPLAEQAIGTCGMSDFMQKSVSATYNSLTSRIDGHGMAPTSLTGLYPDGLMYMRDGSAQVIAMLEAGDNAKALELLRYLINYPIASGFMRDGEVTLPHRIPALKNTLAQERTGASQPLYVADETNTISFELPTSVGGSNKQVTKISLPIRTSANFTGKFSLQVLADVGMPTQVTTADVALTANRASWITFELPPPGYRKQDAPETLTFVLKPTKGTPTDLTVMGEDGLLGFKAFTADMRITDAGNGNDSYAIGTGASWDEMDENLHVFYAWAKYIENTGDTAYLNETWPAVSKFLSFYMKRNWYWLNADMNSAENLLRNPRLDAMGYHDGVYDQVTNVFAAALFKTLANLSQNPAFEQIVEEGPVVTNPGTSGSAPTWDALQTSIENGIQNNLTATVGGKKVYIPWLLPNKTKDTSIGPIWVTLIPSAIPWDGFDHTVMGNTLDWYRANNSFDFGGVEMLNGRFAKHAKPTQYTKNSYTGQWILLKALSWELAFEKMRGNTKRVNEIYLWVGNYFPSMQVPAPESWIVDYPREVPVRDGGNQEHSSWFVNSVLSAYPECKATILSQSKNYVQPPRVGTYTPVPFDRYRGKDRTQTSILAALGTYQGRSPNSVYLARGDNYADAISGGSMTDGPIILLAPGSKLNAEIKSALKTLKPKRVVALGGKGVIAESVLNEAASTANAKKKRLSGSDRFATAAEIAIESFAQAKGAGTPYTTVFLADGLGSDGRGSPDAVSGGGIQNGATLLIDPKSSKLPDATLKALRELKPQQVIALGGKGVVSDSLLNQAKTASGATKTLRLGGKDRYETSAAIAAFAAPFHARQVILVRGDELADSVTAGGLNLGPIVLTSTSSLSNAGTLRIKHNRAIRITVLGGPAVVSDAVAKKAALDAVKPG